MLPVHKHIIPRTCLDLVNMPLRLKITLAPFNINTHLHTLSDITNEWNVLIKDNSEETVMEEESVKQVSLQLRIKQRLDVLSVPVGLTWILSEIQWVCYVYRLYAIIMNSVVNKDVVHNSDVCSQQKNNGHKTKQKHTLCLVLPAVIKHNDKNSKIRSWSNWLFSIQRLE